MSNELVDTGIVTVPVEIKNSADFYVKPRYVHHTTIQSYALDPTGTQANGLIRQAQICEYEPNRVRLAIIVVDDAVSVTMESPLASPDPNDLIGNHPQGGLLPASTHAYEFFGPDAMWVNSLFASPTRVTVIKEYCILS